MLPRVWIFVLVTALGPSPGHAQAPAENPPAPLPPPAATEPELPNAPAPVPPPALPMVDSIAALKIAINAAAPGDTITLKNGSYTTTGAITVKSRGAAAQPIIIAAESIGGVELGGAGGFNFVEPAAHVVVTGFTFTHAAGKNTIGEGTVGVRFTRNIFRCSGDGTYLSVTGDDAQVDHNDFGDKKTTGNMIAVAGTGSQIARRLWIHHNYFHDVTYPGPTGAEMIRFGLTALSQSTGAGLVEHNLFARCRGQNEFISNRSCGNTYRFNTFLDAPNSQFTLRHGHDCIVVGNIFLHTEGLRVFGDRHQVFSNYFEGNYIGVTLGNGSVEVADGGAVAGHDRPDDCVIAFNTFVDNRTHYQMSRRTPEALGATNTTFANNILLGGGVAAKIEGPYTGAVWLGNLLWNPASPGDLPANSYLKIDPLLAPGPDGLRRLQPGSPAIEAAPGSFPLVVFDLDGQPRSEKKTIGADEISAAPATARLLTPANVGPASE